MVELEPSGTKPKWARGSIQSILREEDKMASARMQLYAKLQYQESIRLLTS